MAQSASHEPTDARILDLAAEHIRRHGIERTTVVAIAREAAMSHGNVYRYFPSKLALVDAVTAHWLKPIEEGARDICDAPDPAFDKLERLLTAVHRAYRMKLESDPRLFDLFIEASTEGRGVSRKHRLKLQTVVQKVLEDGMSSGAFASPDQRRALALVFDVCHRFLNPASVRADREVARAQIEGRFERVVRLLRRALTSGNLS
jgi:AcrR family transcriptional regulator